MEKESSKQNIMYVNEKIYKIVILISLISFICATIFFRGSYGFSSIVIRIIFIIGSFSILLITKSIYTENGGEFFKYIIIMYTFIAAENIRSMMFAEGNVSIHNILNYNRIIGDSIVNYVSAIAYCSLAKYFSGRKTHFNIAVMLGIVAFIFGITITSFNYDYEGAALIALSTIILCIYGFYLFDKFKIIKKSKNSKNEINFFKAGLFNIFIIAVDTIIYCFNHNSSYKIIFIFIIGIFFFSNFVINCYCILRKVLNNPYMFMFNEIYENTKLLTNLNKKVEEKNNQLEQKQLIIKEKNSSFKNLFMYIPVPVAILNGSNGRILYSNKHFNSMINKSTKDIVNKKISNLIDFENDEDSSINDQIKRGIFFVGKDKKYVDIEMITNIYDETIMLIFTDVTSKVISDNLQENLDNMIFEEKMKSDFLSNISHDLKTPINVIYSAMQLINSDVENSNFQRIKKYNDISKHNCEVLNNFTNVLINDGKSNIKYCDFEKSYENIAHIIKDVVFSLEDYTRIKNINLKFTCTKDKVEYYCNKESMQRIVMNLISNSIKYCKVQGNIEVVLNDYENEIVILVKDDGIGMDQKFLQKAFERYSMKENNKNKLITRSSGIGLFLVKKMVEEQNGSINISSKLNEGTCIEIILKRGKDCDKHK